MSRYIRALVPGGTFFFTVVTYHRAAFLTGPLARRCLREAFERVRAENPFRIDALCLLPEHIHCVWSLPQGDADFSGRWRKIKGIFTDLYLGSGGGDKGSRSHSRVERQEACLWQRRFWEHVIRDERDFERHADYTHYNPVKHGLVHRAGEWAWSTFRRYVAAGVYDEGWGEAEPGSVRGLDRVGE